MMAKIAGDYEIFSYELDGLIYKCVQDLGELSPGDHICYYEFPYYRHAIIEEINGQTVSLIGWSVGFSSEIKKYMLKLKLASWHNINKAVYPKGCYDVEKVLLRARSRIGETDYFFRTNSSRGFTKWCKTGRGGYLYDDRKAEDRFRRYVSSTEI